MTPDPSPPTSTSNAAGLAVIAVTTLGVAAWLTTQRPGETATASASSAADVDVTALSDFVEIPAGPFLMGSDPAVDPRAFDNERWTAAKPQGTVELATFYIGRHEVTVSQYRAFVEATGFDADPQSLEGSANDPVANVSWPDALAYCRWLETALRTSSGTPLELRRLVENGWRVTLPTEAQWEKAARGTDGRIFPWGNEPRRDRANYRSEATAPVGSFPCPECPYGLSDMSGNVWELTRSPYRPYPYDPSLDDVDLGADALWVMRGGSYSDPERNIRAAIRGGVDPGARRPFIGFRVVLVR